MTGAMDSVTAAEAYRKMRLIRRFEERVVELVDRNEIAGVTHEYIGQEAVAVGVCLALDGRDVLTSTHRGHGHLLARGADPGRMMAELMGRTSGLNRGCGGSMHIADFGLGVLGANGIVAAGSPIATGAAWVLKRDDSGGVAVTFFGDGALNQGVLHEAMNLASIWDLPVVFVCENNRYAVTTSAASSSRSAPIDRAAAAGLRTFEVDGMDVSAVNVAAADAVRTARVESRPSFIDFQTYRFVGHQTAERTTTWRYRPDGELDAWLARDPITTWRSQLVTLGHQSDEALDAIDRAIEEQLDAAVEFARSSRLPNGPEALAYAYASGTSSSFPRSSWEQPL